MKNFNLQVILGSTNITVTWRTAIQAAAKTPVSCLVQKERFFYGKYLSMQSKTKLILPDEQGSRALLCLATGDCFSYQGAEQCSATARARYLPTCTSELLCKQQRWIKDIILHFLSFLGVLLPLHFDCTNVWEQWKRSRRVNAKWGHAAIKLFWILTNSLLFWQWKDVRWVRRIPKPNAEVKPKPEYVQGIFHSVALWWISGRGTLPWQGHKWRRANCPRDHSCRLQGQKSAVTSAGPSDGSRTGIYVRCGISTTASLHPHTDTLQMNVPWHPPAVRLPLENGQFPQWILLWGEQRHWQKVSAVICQVLCADLHCSPCVWLSTWCGHNVLTNPQCTWAGMGCIFQQAFLRGMVGWKFSWQGSNSCHLNIPFQ